MQERPGILDEPRGRAHFVRTVGATEEVRLVALPLLFLHVPDHISLGGARERRIRVVHRRHKAVPPAFQAVVVRAEAGASSRSI